MENNIDNVTYLKADNNKIINERAIKWVKKIDECLILCTRSQGCSDKGDDTHRICKQNNYNSYMKLNKQFD